MSYKTKQIVSRPKEQWIKVEGTHEPIIDRELWNRVHKKINSNARVNQTTGKIHTFSKIAVCMHCGYAMRIHKCHGHYYLECETKSISRKACPGAFIPEAELEQIVIDELRQFNHYLLDQSALERKVQFDYVMNSKKSRLLSEKKRYQEKVVECDIALKQLYIDRVAGVITPKDHYELSSTFQTDKSRYEIIITSCDDQLREIEDYLRMGDNRSDLLSPYIKVEQLNRRIVETLIERIEVGKRNRETGVVPVSIFWSF